MSLTIFDVADYNNKAPVSALGGSKKNNNITPIISNDNLSMFNSLGIII